MQPLDHGVLSVPLSKLGDIDAELDAYKAQLAREAAAATTKELRIAAKAAVASLTTEQLDAIAERIGSTRVQARKELRSLAHWEPGKALVLACAAVDRAALNRANTGDQQ